MASILLSVFVVLLYKLHGQRIVLLEEGRNQCVGCGEDGCEQALEKHTIDRENKLHPIQLSNVLRDASLQYSSQLY